MTRYFFHVRDEDGDISHDREGQDLPDLEAARIEAISTNREMLGERCCMAARSTIGRSKSPMKAARSS